MATTDYGFLAIGLIYAGLLVMGFGTITVAAGHAAGATRSSGRPVRLVVAFVLTGLLGYFLLVLNSVAQGMVSPRSPIRISDPSIVLHCAAYGTLTVPLAATWITALRDTRR